MKYIKFLAFVTICACGSDGIPEKPLSLIDLRGDLNTN